MGPVILCRQGGKLFPQHSFSNLIVYRGNDKPDAIEAFGIPRRTAPIQQAFKTASHILPVCRVDQQDQKSPTNYHQAVARQAVEAARRILNIYCLKNVVGARAAEFTANEVFNA